MRLFIAINFDNQTKQKMVAVQDHIRYIGQGNFTRPENIHLTLAFLGEIEPNRIATITEAMEQTSIHPLTLTFDHIGCFKRSGGDIFWLGISNNKALLSMQKELCNHLSIADFTLENRPFSPHITLIRQARLCHQLNQKKLLPIPFSTYTNRISLMLSERINGKLRYTEIYATLPAQTE